MAIEEFTPIKVLSPIVQLPDTTTCEEIKQLLPILEWCQYDCHSIK